MAIGALVGEFWHDLGQGLALAVAGVALGLFGAVWLDATVTATADLTVTPTDPLTLMPGSGSWPGAGRVVGLIRSGDAAPPRDPIVAPSRGVNRAYGLSVSE